MLVYGDPTFEANLHTVHAGLLARVRLARARPADADVLRALLIACGQVEQGAHDAADQVGLEVVAALHQATAHAADACYSLTWRQAEPLPPPVVDAPTALARLLACLEDIHALPDVRITVKLPEGFSFHALYPEQYAVAAGRWLADERTRGAPLAQATLVVGIRSIGTTLAAIVAAVLKAAGVQVYSCTVRPHGHPYTRRVDASQLEMVQGLLGHQSRLARLPHTPLRALVVDEGPGISGSSMAATGEALEAAGVPPAEIACLPGHAGAPGSGGSAEVQAWWQKVRRFVGEGEQLFFGGRTLAEALGKALATEVGQSVLHMENISGGVWRQTAYPDRAEWPPVCNYFERVKYRATLADGSRVLLKFLGLAAAGAHLASTAETAAAVLEMRAARGLAPPVVGTALGFVMTGWVEGTPLAYAAPGQRLPAVSNSRTAPAARARGTAGTGPAATRADRCGLIAELGRYIAQVAGPALDDAECAASAERLRTMIYVNTSEALGERAADRAVALAGLHTPAANAHFAAYGDGRLLPYEFIQSADGQVRKVDSVGHDCDHTLVGRQPIAWDLAGACVEWQLSAGESNQLVAAYLAADGPANGQEMLHAYKIAYLAFRMGQCALAAEVHDPYERERLQNAYAIYRKHLVEALL